MPTLAVDVMTTPVYSVSPSMPLSSLEWELSHRRVSGAPVIEDGKLVGMISRADIVRRIGFSHAMSEMALDYYRQLEGTPTAARAEEEQRLAEQTLGSQLRTLSVRDAMTSHPVSIGARGTTKEVAALMLEHAVHRVLVVEGNQLLGIVSTFDLVRLLANAPE